MLRQRVISACVMIPPALAAVWFGSWAFAALIALAVALMVWEWHGMIRKEFALSGWLAAALLAVAALAVPLWPLVSLGLLIAATVLSLLLSPSHRGWMLSGALYVGVPALALVWMRGDDVAGRQMIFWLFLLVWATDTGAYAFGRLIGGPLLLPVVSPKKTWAGLLGGALCAGLVGAGTAHITGSGSLVFLTVISAGLAVVAQAGDLFESWVKRRWGVKDSSAIIPGHGGILDRVDGLLTVAAVIAGIAVLTGAPVIQW